MRHDQPEPGQPWSLILAGGEGRRLSPLIQRWMGRHRPKQYCTFTGSRSMFQHTLDRADQVAPPAHKLIVVARAHAQEAFTQVGSRRGRLILQPLDRDTAPGIALPLTYIRRACRADATVVIYPSDHFVYPEDRFVVTVRAAVRAAERKHDRLVLLGVQPDRPEADYGWIQRGPELDAHEGRRVWAVTSFQEKPDPAWARTARQQGALWNTLVLAARVDTLWRACWRCLPEIMPLFDELHAAIGTGEEGAVLERIYDAMPARNFSRDVLQRAPDSVAVMELTDVLWSDWGRAGRIVETLGRIGSRPPFQLTG
jgi:mannose-1-phosphate guanylyltransferase